MQQQGLFNFDGEVVAAADRVQQKRSERKTAQATAQAPVSAAAMQPPATQSPAAAAPAIPAQAMAPAAVAPLSTSPVSDPKDWDMSREAFFSKKYAGVSSRFFRSAGIEIKHNEFRQSLFFSGHCYASLLAIDGIAAVLSGAITKAEHTVQFDDLGDHVFTRTGVISDRDKHNSVCSILDYASAQKATRFLSMMRRNDDETLFRVKGQNPAKQGIRENGVADPSLFALLLTESIAEVMTPGSKMYQNN